MGTIKADIKEYHLKEHPSEEHILKAFLPCFSVTWAKKRKAYNTELSVYFLSPEPFMSELFGFEQELMLVYSPYHTLEPRAVQAADSFMIDSPARGRVENLTYFFISEAPDVDRWFHSYTSVNSVNQEARLIIPISAQELRVNYSDSWFIRNHISKFLYGRDLFDLRLPLEKDTYFFGRSDYVVKILDALKRTENCGIFGLRKTGKTSLIYKIERLLKAEGTINVFYYDCKMPSIRNLRWHELLASICEDLGNEYNISINDTINDKNASKIFFELASKLDKPALLIFDEIEYISPVAIHDDHWHRDFLDFWQTFWGTQSRYRTITAMIAGVNPYVVEVDTIGGVQNPLFGIVSTQYLTGLSIEDTKNMARTLGKRMGLKFDFEATSYLHDRYGGHPLLTRMACSITNNIIKNKNEIRPVTITKNRLQNEEAERDAELTFYCRHVVSELKQFYPDEYEMLELLASGQIHSFVEFAAYPEYSKHLRAYCLLTTDMYGRPDISIPVIKRYIGLELAREEGRQTLLKIVPSDERARWIDKRKQSIRQDISLLERAIQQTQTASLFGPNSFPDADKFMNLGIVTDEISFENFINTCNKCFVESIENYGKTVGKNKYYWEEIKKTYPGLWHALHRIKIYRHERMHIQLNTAASQALTEYLSQDLENRNPSSIEALFFILQQCVLDSLLTGLQIEISNIS